ncbi:cupin domain-containing protein [Sphingobacterium sp. DN00404]|uniref:Cupin domain-containing protein n=1 Tax=Sphingobacterium micropteri TaxID=2763501 RepID=A0ABR7YJ88_9SPHI|nr:cupin domain-containing protein [Sphingobacterium micropteri]MBD1431364.1 cupin domain-containing protein [Sphingobacterium micropteri]
MSTTIETALVSKLKERVAYKKDGIVKEIIKKSDTGHIIMFAFDKGQELKEHSAPFDAVLQALDGEALIHIAGEPHIVKAGEMIILPATIPHAVAATTAFKMLLTSIRD